MIIIRYAETIAAVEFVADRKNQLTWLMPLTIFSLELIRNKVSVSLFPLQTERVASIKLTYYWANLKLHPVVVLKSANTCNYLYFMFRI